MSQKVPWSELRAERSYWVRPSYDVAHTYPATFLGWNGDQTEATFVVYFGEGKDGPVAVSPHDDWVVYDGRPEELGEHP